jgi:uncharacterized protein (TIGR00730 family)
MTRLWLSALLALAPALPAAAQVRVAAIDAAGIAAAHSAIAPLGAVPIVSALSASAPAPLSLGPAFSAAASPAMLPAASAPLPALPAAAASVAPALAALPAARAGDAPASASVVPAASNPAAPGRAPPAERTGPVVLHSLQDLHLLQSPDGALAAGSFFDASRASRGAVSEPASGKPQVFADMPGVAVKSVRGGLSEFQAHEVATIKKIQVYAQDLRVLVREAAATPDLVVNGVVTELKSVHKGGIERQLAHANGQLVSHAKRHDLGLGAVVLDVLRHSLTTSQIEAGIAQVLREEPTIGFDRVYVFEGDGLRTFAPSPDGVFRLDAAATPFAPARAAAPAAPAAPTNAYSFVPSALSHALLPDMDVVTREIQEPSRLLRARGIEATVTMYGSARIASPEKAQAKLDVVLAETGPRPKDKAGKTRLAEAREALRMSKYYRIARELGALVAQEGGGKVAVVTGGGPGIMEAGNRGAFEAGGPSVGYNIKLPHEQGLNPYATRELEFTFENFATRKMALRHGAMGLVYFPGGFGTMDELFEVLTLMQTGKMPKVPIVLVGERAYWDHILDFDEFAHMGLISPGDLSLFTFAEDAPQAWAAIRAAHSPAVAAR